jgi:hypothetical protein
VGCNGYFPLHISVGRWKMLAGLCALDRPHGQYVRQCRPHTYVPRLFSWVSAGAQCRHTTSHALLCLWLELHSRYCLPLFHERKLYFQYFNISKHPQLNSSCRNIMTF